MPESFDWHPHQSTENPMYYKKSGLQQRRLLLLQLVAVQHLRQLSGLQRFWLLQLLSLVGFFLQQLCCLRQLGFPWLVGRSVHVPLRSFRWFCLRVLCCRFRWRLLSRLCCWLLFCCLPFSVRLSKCELNVG